GTFLDEGTDLTLPNAVLVFGETVGFSTGAAMFFPASPIPGAKLLGTKVTASNIVWGSAADTGLAITITDGMAALSGNAIVEGPGEYWYIEPGSANAFLGVDPGSGN